MKKTFYFVRHGESESNATRVGLGEASALTERGHKESRVVGERFTRLPIDKIITSTYKRALQTTEGIKEFVHKEVQESDLFVERRKPSEALGKGLDDPQVMRIESEILQNRLEDSHYQYSDEESFEDLKERAQKAITLLEKQKEENIIVVTHGLFLRHIITYMIFGRNLTVPEYMQFATFFVTHNTGITVCVFDSDVYESTNKWKILTWNDHAHLSQLLDNTR